MADGTFDGALRALTHETRVAILRQLAEADGPLSFTELKSRVGATDSGRFNYHLNELCEHYLRDGPDGYELNYRGEQVLVAAGAGVTAGDGPARSGVEDACPVCGEDDCDRLIHVHLDSPV